MIEPELKDDRFIVDVRNAGREPGRLHLWWLGQSGFLVQCGRRHLLFDPYLSDSLTKKYADTDKPHERMTERVIDPRKLDFIDVVTSSHNHTDHLDAETLTPLMDANEMLHLVVPTANRDFVSERLGCDPAWPVCIDAGETIDVANLEFTAVPAAHEDVERDSEGHCRYLGYVVRCGQWTLYHSGDTVLYDGMEETLRKFSIDIAMLPINGRKPERGVAGNLDGAEAANLAKAIGAKLVIPCHYDMFTFNTESPDLFERTCKKLDQPYKVLKAGERLTL